MVGEVIVSDMVGKVKGHGQNVLRRQVERPSGCPKCERRGGRFRFHEAKLRFFLVVVMRLVKRVPTHLARWKCPHCGRTFIAYPDFAVPHKHYVWQEVVERPHRYVEGAAVTYAEAAGEDGMPVFHDGEAGEREGAQMSRSTVWRWVGFIAACARVLRRLLRGIRRAAEVPAASLPTGRCRTRGRETVLRDCLDALGLEAEYRRQSGRSIFLPHLGTGGLSG